MNVKMEGNVFYLNCARVLQDGPVISVTKVSSTTSTVMCVLIIMFSDINECSGNHTCDHACADTHGSFVCSCDDGFDLQSDGRTCIGKFNFSELHKTVPLSEFA